MIEIDFHIEDTEFNVGIIKNNKKWLTNILQDNNINVAEISYIFCSDDYLLKINKEYLEHDTYTDIITFDLSEEEGTLFSDIFISIDRVKENAENLHQGFIFELSRVMVHGILHLLGHEDNTDLEKQNMRELENTALAKLSDL